MATLSFRATSHATDATFTVTSLNVGAPAGVAVNDLLIGLFSATVIDPVTPTVLTPPAGWTEIRHDPQTIAGGAATTNVSLCWKIATGSDSYTFTTADPAGVTGVVAAYDNPLVAGPFQTSSRTTFSASTSGVASTVTTDQAAMLVAFVAYTDATATWTAPAGMTERDDFGSFTLADVQQAVAGATGSKTGTASVSGTGAAYLLTFYSEDSAGGGETITLDKWFRAVPDVARRKVGMVPSGTIGIKA